MAGGLILGIDIGTQGTKAVLFTNLGEVLSQAFEPSKLISSQPGQVIQDPDDVFLSVVRTIHDALQACDADTSQVAAVGLTGQMAGIMGVDDRGIAVTPYDSWLDTRCEPYFDVIRSRAGSRFIQTTGSPITYAHGPKVLWWQHERPDVYRTVAKFVVPTAYVALRLCGLGAEHAYIDYTQIHFSGFANVADMTWSDELISLLGMDAGKLPAIVDPWKVIGGIDRATARMTGLAEGTPVIAGCGDQAATSLGAGITKPGQILDVSGTACLLSFCTDTYAPDIVNQTFLYARSAVKGLWIPLAYAGSGHCLRWFMDELAHDVDGGLAGLDRMAAKIAPGSDRLLFIPHFGGRTCPNNPNVRGSYLGLTWTHTKAQMYRAILEGIGYEYHYYLKVMEQLIGAGSTGDVVVIGGGSKSTVFNQIKADILNKRYRTLNRRDGAPLGSAVLAGFGTGLLPDLHHAIDGMIEARDLVEPQAAAHRQYQGYAEAYADAIDRLCPVYEKLIRT